MRTCPVCSTNMSSKGDVVYKEDEVTKISPIFAEYKGKKYLVCSQACKDEFNANPKEYINSDTTSIYVPKPPKAR